MKTSCQNLESILKVSIRVYLVIISLFVLNSCSGQKKKSETIDRPEILKLGSVELKNKSYSKAVEFFTKVIENSQSKDSLYIKALRLRAWTNESPLKFDSAIVDYEAILADLPNDIQTLHSLSGLYGELGNFEKCFTLLDIILKNYPDDFFALNDYSYFKNKSGDFKDGLGYSKLALEKTSDSIWIGVVYNNMSYSYLKLGSIDKSFRLVNKSLVFYPKNSFAYRNRALCYIEKGDYLKACQDLDICKELGGFQISEELKDKYCK